MNSANSWVAADLAGAKANQSYFEFILAPANGKRVSLSSLKFTSYQQNTHPASALVVEYSTNGFATPGVPIATNTPINSAWAGLAMTAELSSVAGLQNFTSSVTFRLWGFGCGAFEDKGLGQIAGSNDDVVLTGTVTSMVPPVLSFQKVGPDLRLTWSEGTLLEASELTGPWITNQAGSPFTLTPSAPRKFYRLQVP